LPVRAPAIALTAVTALVGSIGAIAVGALVEDDAALAADAPEQALEKNGELVKPGDRWVFAVAVEGAAVWCVIQIVCPWLRRPSGRGVPWRPRRSATAGSPRERSTSRADIRRRGVTVQRARYVCDLQRDARRYYRSSTPEDVSEMARLNLFEAGHTPRDGSRDRASLKSAARGRRLQSAWPFSASPPRGTGHFRPPSTTIRLLRLGGGTELSEFFVTVCD
jgi:hypothetical protein